MWKEIKLLIYKEFLIEWKQKYALNGLVLYVLSMIMVISLSYIRLGSMPTYIWNILYWLLILFASINAIAKSFMSESQGQFLYLYTLARPSSVILAKIIYNSLLLFFLGLITFFLFALLNSVNIAEGLLFSGFVLLGSLAMAGNLTLVSAIAAKAENNVTLFAVLGFPIIVPILLSLIKGANIAVEGWDGVSEGSLDTPILTENLAWIGGISLVLWLTSILLFPFVWRN